MIRQKIPASFRILRRDGMESSGEAAETFGEFPASLMVFNESRR